MTVKFGLTDIAGGFGGTDSIQKMYVGDEQVRPASQYPTESIVYKMKAGASGNLYAPASIPWSGALYSYDWNISIDGGAETNYSGTSTSGGTITIGTGYTPDTEHIIVIKPVTETYGWAKAFCFRNVGVANLLTEVIQDKSYMGFADSATDAGIGFRSYQYAGTSITKAPAEVIPDTVTTEGGLFRAYQYYGCTSLTTAPAEVFPNSITSVSSNFRLSQYEGCTSLTAAALEVMPNSITGVDSDFRANQYFGCTSITGIINEVYPSSNPIPGYRFRNSQFYGTSITGANIIASEGSGNSSRILQFFGAGGGSLIAVTISGNIVDDASDEAVPYGLGVAGLTTNNCSQIRVPSTLLSAYQSASNWSSVSSLFVGY